MVSREWGMLMETKHIFANSKKSPPIGGLGAYAINK
jgi:hypothetical protein